MFILKDALTRQMAVQCIMIQHALRKTPTASHSITLNAVFFPLFPALQTMLNLIQKKLQDGMVSLYRDKAEHYLALFSTLSTKVSSGYSSASSQCPKTCIWGSDELVILNCECKSVWLFASLCRPCDELPTRQGAYPALAQWKMGWGPQHPYDPLLD